MGRCKIWKSNLISHMSNPIDNHSVKQLILSCRTKFQLNCGKLKISYKAKNSSQIINRLIWRRPLRCYLENLKLTTKRKKKDYLPQFLKIIQKSIFMGLVNDPQLALF